MMEALSELLRPYESTVGSLAEVITMLQLLAPAFIIKEIYDVKSTKGKVPTPFIGGLYMGYLTLIYGKVINDPVMINVNTVAICLNTVYCFCYYLYSEDSKELLSPLAYTVAVLGAVFAYSQVEDVVILEYRLGLLVTVSMFALLASPLASIKEIVRTRSAETLPMPIFFSAALVSFLWLLYGIILLNYFMVVQNVVGLILCLVQIIVWIFFRGGVSGVSSPKLSKAKKAKTKKAD